MEGTISSSIINKDELLDDTLSMESNSSSVGKSGIDIKAIETRRSLRRTQSKYRSSDKSKNISEKRVSSSRLVEDEPLRKGFPTVSK